MGELISFFSSTEDRDEITTISCDGNASMATFSRKLADNNRELVVRDDLELKGVERTETALGHLVIASEVKVGDSIVFSNSDNSFIKTAPVKEVLDSVYQPKIIKPESLKERT